MHPTTLSVWGDTNWLLKPLALQSPFGILFSIATTGHILYTLFTVTTSGTWWPCMSAGVKSQLTAQLWSMSFRFSSPFVDPTWLCPGARSCVPSLPALPTPPLMFSPMRGTCKSHIRNRCSHPTRRSGVKNYMQSHMSYLLFLWRTLQFIFKKSKYSHNLMPSNARKTRPPPLYQGQTQTK